MINLYVTIKEVVEYLDIPEKFIVEKIREGIIRTVSDGEQLLVNKNQFDRHLKLMKKRLEEFKQEKNEPLPEDYDYKDED